MACLCDFVFQIAWKDIHRLMYMGILIARLLHRKLYAWLNAYRKEVNAKVRNYNLRNLDKETNMKVLKLL